MKTLKTSLKTIALFFMALTLLQSCVAYQKTPVSLRQAEQSKKRVKMKTSANQTYYFKQIVSEEEQFYGLIKEKRELVKVTISDYGNNEVFLYSKSKSTWKTIGTITVPVIVVLLIAGISARNNGYGAGLEW
tara:strand:+ start:214 stop:609 length:396 start_codon:yes stop_codon:yes gene_type:complete